MKKILFSFFFFLFYLLSYSQKNDAIWFFGNYNNVLNRFNFSNTVLEIDTIPSSLNIRFTNLSFADSLGNLLFFSNGRAIYDNNLQLALNGDSLNPGYLFAYNEPYGAYSVPQGMVAFNSYTEANEFIVFHLTSDTIYSSSIDFRDKFNVTSLLSTELKKENDTLKVFNKNQIVINDTLSFGGLAACKHGNGRDWWLIAIEANTNCYYRLLYNPSGIENIDKICLGYEHKLQEIDKSNFVVFSPDGTKYIRGSEEDGVEIFSFDRCDGSLSLIEQIPRSDFLSATIQDQEFGGFVAVSPNSKFLYVSTYGTIFQLNLESANINASKTIVAQRDSTPPFTYIFYPFQLASDGKIYISGSYIFNNPHFHRISNPDLEGLGCNIEVEIPLQKPGTYSFPYFPNYRLGALVGSPCDTLGVGIKELSKQISLTVHPNPANSYVAIDYGFLPWQSNSKASLQLLNTLGEVVYSQNLPPYSAFQFINVKDFPPGFYVVAVWDNGKLIGKENVILNN